MATPPVPAGHARAATPVQRALDDSEPLAVLLARVQASRARLDAVQGVLGPALAGAVRAGPLDDTHWVLLADSSAAAAELRQMLPTLAQALADAGHAPRELKVKVLPRAAGRVEGAA
jgi:hypothetical protein